MVVDYSTLKHVAIVLDGNRRWAKKKGLPTLQGHKKGFENIKELAKYILNTEIEVLSVFAFSTENFNRSKEEVDYLMDIFATGFKKYGDELGKENIKVVFSGRKEPLREDVIEMMAEVEEKTKNNTKGIFNICLNYGGQSEIIDASLKIYEDLNNNKIKKEEIDNKLFSKYLYNDLGPIDLYIRTSGEYRISNFMLWQLAYAEMYFTEVCFPDFNKDEFDKAVLEYNNRNRRFGGDQK